VGAHQNQWRGIARAICLVMKTDAVVGLEFGHDIDGSDAELCRK
jgi:hypothetical protein